MSVLRRGDARLRTDMQRVAALQAPTLPFHHVMMMMMMTIQ